MTEIGSPAVYFTAYSAAAATLREAIEAAKGGNPLAPVTVVPPSNYSGLSFRRLLGRDGGLVNVRFMNLPRLAEFAGIRDLPPGATRPLTALVRAEAVRALLADSPGRFGPVAAHPSTARELNAAFRELEELDESQLEELAAASRRAAEVVRLYREFREETASFYSRTDLFRAATRSLETNPGALPDLGQIVAVLPTHLSPSEDALLGALSAAGRLAVVDASLGDENTGRGALVFADGGTRPPELPVPSRIVVAVDADEEVRAIVSLVLQEMERGTDASQIACYYQAAEIYGPLLQEQLRAAGIPFNAPLGETLAATPPARALAGFVGFALNGIVRRDLMQWLGSAPIRDGGRPVRSRAWNRLSRNAGIVGGPAVHWRATLVRYGEELARREQYAVGAGNDGLARAMSRERADCEGLANFVDVLESALAPPDNRSWAGWASWARSGLAAFFDRRDSDPRQEEAFEAVTAVLDELAGLADVSPGRSIDEATFAAMLAAQLDRPRSPESPFGRGVLVAPLSMAPGIPVHASFVVGMVEGQLPGAERDTGLLDEAARERVPGLPSRSRRLQEVRLAYLAALASAERSTISFPRGSLRSGRGHLPSRWLLEAASRLAGERVDSEAFERLGGRDWLLRVPAGPHRVLDGLPAATASDFVQARIATSPGGDPAAVEPALRTPLECVLSRRAGRLTRFDGQAGALGGATAPPVTVAPTRLERWARCPFQYLLTDVLRVEEYEEPEEIVALSPLDRGAVIHEALDRFYSETSDRGPGPWSAAERDLLNRIAAEICSRLEAAGRTGRTALWDIERTRILVELQELLTADEQRSAELGARFWRSELGFGSEGDELPAVTIPLAGGATVAFRGRIDRVDRLGDGSCWIYDYKTGSSRGLGNLDDVLDSGRRLQLLVYAEALRRGAGVDSVQAGYWMVNDSERFEVKDLPMGPDTTAALARTLGHIHEGLASGSFIANPSNDNCDYCPYDALCVADRQRAFERKQRDPAAAPYRLLREGTP